MNLGNQGEFTIKELANEVARACDVTPRIKYLPLPQDDPQQRQPDIARATQLFRWSPKISLREGLQHAVAYFSQRLGRQKKSHAPSS